MNDKFTSKQLKVTKAHNHKSQREAKTPFTSGFYRFLFGLTLIIALSFVALFFLGIRSAANETVPPPDAQLAQ